ncbi:uncharacterized protein LOC143373893 [Andrena cerasifolii]|uniref:uncharacterized protein LOC143373893 n=1 Tax=Andrena cerasifolii TaxID=2819439 RepID=UPI00403844EC
MTASKVLLLLYLSTLYLTCCDASDARASDLSAADDVKETQHATCKIATEELVATASATVTRVLTGACNAKAIDERLDTLERSLTKRLEEIKAMLHSVLGTKKETPGLARIPKTERNTYYKEDATKSNSSPRQSEIDKLNNTVQFSSPNGPSFFFYYWQMRGFDEKLTSWDTARSERSVTFYVGQNGYAMYMKVTPRYFPDGTVFVGVGLTRGRHDSVLQWPFLQKIRLEILDHSMEQSRQDRRSRIWDPSTLCSEYFWGRPKLTGEPDNPECVGLSVSRQALLSNLGHPARPTKYLWKGSITMKLTVYL